MKAERYSRIAFDEPTDGPLDVRVYDGDGNLLRVITGAMLSKRTLTHQRAPEMARPTAPKPDVPMVKARRREERP